MKRVIDCVLASIALLVFAPLVVLVAVLVRLKLGSPVIFAQQRPGLGARPFKMYKFRSMTDARDSAGNLLPDAQRLTRFGKFLRTSSLDELPELVNVLRGDMSLVGPRPLLMSYVPLYTKHQFRRHEVRPGISGWAQVNGRNALSWEARFDLDVWYVDHRSNWLDFKILLLTVVKVFKKEGISQPGEATMSPFTGSSIRESRD